MGSQDASDFFFVTHMGIRGIERESTPLYSAFLDMRTEKILDQPETLFAVFKRSAEGDVRYPLGEILGVGKP